MKEKTENYIEDQIYIESTIVEKEIETDINCITGDQNHFLIPLKEAFQKAKKVDIIVAFLMESGVKLLKQELGELVKKNIPIRILTGNYLNITQPQALYLLKDILGDKVDLRFYNVPNKSFHPKAYFFQYEGNADLFIGSSNVSCSALTSGIEWNYRLNREKNKEAYENFHKTFEDLFLNQSIIVDEAEMKRYSEVWKKPKVYYDIEKIEEEEKDKVLVFPQPKEAQIEALYNLKKAREEHLDRAIVVAATGIGKTYLAAFDSRKFKKVLFVAHREEILKQAMQTFANVRKESTVGLFSGERKEKDCDVVLATVQTLGQDQYLTEDQFKRDEFDYIVIDEFHHATAGNYQKILNYFKPKFLLGLTATPERLDNKDVFAICDYNVAYEVRLKTAIDKGWLVPFRYYGVYDETDYSIIDFKNGKYDEKELEKALMIHQRAEVIFKHYEKYKSKRALGFCTSRSHAEYMAKYFSQHKIKACAVYSGENEEYAMNRKEAISKLLKGEINVIFSVDMFNEGLDVPSVDMVMFLRPTESPTIFLQQLGRGLRKSTGKQYLNVLDFIGNYKRAIDIPFFLTGNIKDYGKKGKGYIPEEEEYPEDCIINFDLNVVDIFKKQAEAFTKGIDLIKEEYFRIKADLNKRPSRLQLFTYMDEEVYLNTKRRAEYNIFNNYFAFLKDIGELTEEEISFMETKAFIFINELEKTSMVKSYKMPLLLGFYNGGNLKFKLNEDDIYISFRDFYQYGSNGLDMIRHEATKNYLNWGKAEYLRTAKNPQDAFLNSAKDFFYKEGKLYCMVDELEAFKDNTIFIENFKDVIEFRTRKFYKERLEKEK